MKIKYLILLILTCSCSTSIKNFDNYQKQFLTKSKFMPDKETLERKSPKVVVFALDENNNDVAKQAGLGNTMANNIENAITQNRLAELIDRGAATKLEKEISLNEMNKTGSYKGPKIADYAISGAISNAGFVSKFSSGQALYVPKQGVITIPPKFSYSSNVAGNIKIYELPSLTVVETIEFSGKKTRSEDVQSDGGLSLGALRIGGKATLGSSRDDSLVRRAGEDAIDNIKTEIKNAFAKKGYILEKRVYDGKAIFKINLGSADGIKNDDRLEVTGQFETENQITNEIEVERRVIAHGTVSDKIDYKTCWIVIDDAKKADSIRLGDAVKTKYQKSSMAGISKFFKSLVD